MGIWKLNVSRRARERQTFYFFFVIKISQCATEHLLPDWLAPLLKAYLNSYKQRYFGVSRCGCCWWLAHCLPVNSSPFCNLEIQGEIIVSLCVPCYWLGDGSFCFVFCIFFFACGGEENVKLLSQKVIFFSLKITNILYLRRYTKQSSNAIKNVKQNWMNPKQWMRVN